MRHLHAQVRIAGPTFDGSGRHDPDVFVYNFKAVNLDKDDVDGLPQDVITSLLSDISGAKLDPKDTQPVQPTVSEQPRN